MKHITKGKGTLILGICFGAILLFNLLLFPLLLSWGAEKSGVVEVVPEARFMPTVTQSSTEANAKTLPPEVATVEWCAYTYLANSQSSIVKRISEFEENSIEIASLDSQVAENILSEKEIMEYLKKRVTNLKDTNHYTYTLQLIKSDVPGIPYKYNILLGTSEGIRAAYEDSDPFASYYETAKIVVPLKGDIYLGRTNYLQVNALTGDILILISQIGTK